MEMDAIIITVDPSHHQPGTKKRIANPDEWASTKRKRLRQSGQEYIDCRGQLRPARTLRPIDCSDCRRKCAINFPDEERMKIHEYYWGLGDSEKQRLFISVNVEEVPVNKARAKDMSRRSVNRHYYFRRGKKRCRVCQRFFLATLDITESVIAGILRNRDEESNFPRPSLQGKLTKHGRPEETKEAIRSHIRSFPTEAEVPGKKQKGEPKGEGIQYIAAGLNLKRMYDLYVDHCNWEQIVPEKLWHYRNIFKTEFGHLRFIDPK